MIIEGPDFQLIPVKDSTFNFDLNLLTTINKGKSKERQEFKNAGYGYSLENAILKIIKERLDNKYETLSLRDFLKEFRNEVKEIKKLCNVNN